MNLHVLDTETTGLEGDIVEIAMVHPETGAWFSSLVKPSCPIEFQAMATHHITEKMVENAPTLDEVCHDNRLPELMEEDEAPVFAAHNAAFDKKFLIVYPFSDPSVRWICTYRCALHLWPDAPSHSNQVLRYWLNLDLEDMPAEAGGTPHRALYDALVTSRLLMRMVLEIQSTVMRDDGPFCSLEAAVGELIRLTSEPVLLRKIRFGKHAGKSFQDLPRDYLSWLVRQGDGMDADVLHTARHWLGAR